MVVVKRAVTVKVGYARPLGSAGVRGSRVPAYELRLPASVRVSSPTARVSWLVTALPLPRRSALRRSGRGTGGSWPHEPYEPHEVGPAAIVMTGSNSVSCVLLQAARTSSRLKLDHTRLAPAHLLVCQ